MFARAVGFIGVGRDRQRALRWTAAALGTVGLFVTAGPASAEIEGPCQAFFNGIPVDEIDTPAEAREHMVLEEGDMVVYSGTSEVEVGFVAVDLVFSPLSFELFRDEVSDESRTYSGSARVGDVAQYGQGIYEVRARTAACTGNAFLVLGGTGTPWNSLAGQVGMGVAAIGLLLAVFGAWLPAVRGWGIRWPAAVSAAVPLGLGSALLVQQSGYYPLGATLLGVAVAAVLVVTALLAAGISALSGAGAGGSAPDAAGPGTAAMPRPPSFSPPPRPDRPPAAATTDTGDGVATSSGARSDGAAGSVPAGPGGAATAPATGPSVTVGTPADSSSTSGIPTPAAPPPAASSEASGPPVADAGTAPAAVGARAGGPGPDISNAASEGGPNAPDLPGVGAEAGSTVSPPGAGAQAGSTSPGSTASLPGVGAEAGSTSPTASGTSGGGVGSATTGAASGATATDLPLGSGVDLASLAGRGVLGLATTGALARGLAAAAKRKRADDDGDGADPYWFSVEAPTAVYPLSGENEIVDYLPGDDWYLAVATYDEWVHVEDSGRGIAGFVARHVVNPADSRH